MSAPVMRASNFIEFLIPARELRRLKRRPTRFEREIDVLSLALTMRQKQDHEIADELRRIAAELRQTGYAPDHSEADLETHSSPTLDQAENVTPSYKAQMKSPTLAVQKSFFANCPKLSMMVVQITLSLFTANSFQ